MTSIRRGGIYSANIDWFAVGLYLALVVMGWFNIYAATNTGANNVLFDISERYGLQLIWIGISLVLGLFMMLVDYKYYHIFAYPTYVLALLLILVTLTPLGYSVKGASAWLRFGPVAIQPAEFMKIGAALAVARYMSNYSFNIHKLSNLIVVATFLFIPIIVILLQNDTGSALVYCSFIFMLYREGMNSWFYIVIAFIIALFVLSFWIEPATLTIILLAVCVLLQTLRNKNTKASIRFFAGAILLSIIVYYIFAIFRLDISLYVALLIGVGLTVPMILVYAFKKNLRNVVLYLLLFIGSVGFASVTDVVFDHMQAHQQHRILDLLGLEYDSSHWGYNVAQSEIAIGSGGFLGKGFMNGTQTKFNFVPEQETDFIFCTVGEEWGFVGSIVVLGIFLLLIIRLMQMGERQQEPFGRVYCYSVAGIFLAHVIVNVGMTIGIMPVIGIPLPFFSYGGSSFLAFSLLFFIALRLDEANRETNSFTV